MLRAYMGEVIASVRHSIIAETDGMQLYAKYKGKSSLMGECKFRWKIKSLDANKYLRKMLKIGDNNLCINLSTRIKNLLFRIMASLCKKYTFCMYIMYTPLSGISFIRYSSYLYK